MKVLAAALVFVAACSEPQATPAPTLDAHRAPAAVLVIHNAPFRALARMAQELADPGRWNRGPGGGCVLYPPGDEPGLSRPKVCVEADEPRHTLRLHGDAAAAEEIRVRIERVDALWEQAAVRRDR